MRFGSILILTGTVLLGIGGTPAAAQETDAPEAPQIRAFLESIRVPQ
jgi:hypothetical protein